MRLNRAVLAGIALMGVTALFFVGGCTSTSTRADLKVVSVNGGGTFYSDLFNDKDSLNPYIPTDNVIVTFANSPHDGSTPVDPGTPFSEIIVDHYKVTYNNGIYSPIEGGMILTVASGTSVDASIAISNPSEKAALLSTLTTTNIATARIDFTGWVRTAGNNGDRVSAVAYLSVQVDNFADK